MIPRWRLTCALMFIFWARCSAMSSDSLIRIYNTAPGAVYGQACQTTTSISGDTVWQLHLERTAHHGKVLEFRQKFMLCAWGPDNNILYRFTATIPYLDDSFRYIILRTFLGHPYLIYCDGMSDPAEWLVLNLERNSPESSFTVPHDYSLQNNVHDSCLTDGAFKLYDFVTHSVVEQAARDTFRNLKKSKYRINDNTVAIGGDSVTSDSLVYYYYDLKTLTKRDSVRYPAFPQRGPAFGHLVTSLPLKAYPGPDVRSFQIVDLLTRKSANFYAPDNIDDAALSQQTGTAILHCRNNTVWLWDFKKNAVVDSFANVSDVPFSNGDASATMWCDSAHLFVIRCQSTVKTSIIPIRLGAGPYACFFDPGSTRALLTSALQAVVVDWETNVVLDLGFDEYLQRSTVSSVCYRPEAHRVFITGDSTRVKVFDTNDGSLARQLPERLYSGDVRWIDLCDSLRTIVVMPYEFSSQPLATFDSKSGTKKKSIKDLGALRSELFYSIKTNYLYLNSPWVPGSSSISNVVVILNSTTLDTVKVWYDSRSARVVGISDDGSVVLTADDDSHLMLRSSRTMEVIRDFSLSGTIKKACISKNNEVVAYYAVGSRTVIGLLSVTTSDTLCTYSSYIKDPIYLSFDASGSYVMSSNELIRVADCTRESLLPFSLVTPPEYCYVDRDSKLFEASTVRGHLRSSIGQYKEFIDSTSGTYFHNHYTHVDCYMGVNSTDRCQLIDRRTSKLIVDYNAGSIKNFTQELSPDSLSCKFFCWSRYSDAIIFVDSANTITIWRPDLKGFEENIEYSESTSANGLIHLYPNPADETIAVDLSAVQSPSCQFFTAIVTNTFGEEVQRFAVSESGHTQLQTGSLPSGVYGLQLISSGEMRNCTDSAHVKFVIHH